MPSGIDDLRRQLTALARSLEREAGPAAVRAGLDVIEAGVRRRIPVRTGALVASESETDPGDRAGWVSGVVLVTSDHAAAVEFGTAKMVAEPYMRPTLEQDGPKALDAMAGALADSWKGMV